MTSPRWETWSLKSSNIRETSIQMTNGTRLQISKISKIWDLHKWSSMSWKMENVSQTPWTFTRTTWRSSATKTFISPLRFKLPSRTSTSQEDNSMIAKWSCRDFLKCLPRAWWLIQIFKILLPMPSKEPKWKVNEKTVYSK